MAACVAVSSLVTSTLYFPAVAGKSVVSVPVATFLYFTVYPVTSSGVNASFGKFTFAFTSSSVAEAGDIVTVTGSFALNVAFISVAFVKAGDV